MGIWELSYRLLLSRLGVLLYVHCFLLIGILRFVVSTLREGGLELAPPFLAYYSHSLY